MKKLFPLFILLVTLFVSTSCSMNTEPTWTVYTDIGTYSEFKQAFGTTLDDVIMFGSNSLLVNGMR